ncbi:WD40/YVTN/BNR-like repeat-containing protein [Bryocella elongata]|uniref:WD40/YVTN/BNR-like repeat-containing protein n=1 Tax=Bryocella elongata TaxID=863522 RepID=UPI003898E735
MCLWGAFFAAAAHASPWFPLGPFGGDARSLVSDPANPKRLYMGTDTGWIYRSDNGGGAWTRVAHIAKRDDLVIDEILIDARDANRILVAAYSKDTADGGLFISEDSGRSWYEQAELSGQSVRSLGRSLSSPEELVAGTLKGVYRSGDGGKHWTLISPAGSTEIHEVESVAVDPNDPNIIYAGTWHLPWKTTDGGAHWVNIKEGIIDDSDVFSIIVDPKDPQVVYASACSGIYKSTTGAEPNSRESGKRFSKVQGIPSTARRTRKLGQDPHNRDTVFAGTTEGLYRTIDAGQHWDRMTGGDVIVNDVWIDPTDSNHVLLATDRGGVLSSFDGGVSFSPSNRGFSNRQVVTLASNLTGANVYIGLLNDKSEGGVFKSTDGGVTWLQESSGLAGRDVFSLAASADGTMLAGTAHGIYRLTDNSWADANIVAAPASPSTADAAPLVRKVTPARSARSRPAAARKPAARSSAPAQRVDTAFYSLVSTDHSILAGTSDGVMMADAMGRDWKIVRSLTMPDARFVAVHQKMVLAASLKRMALSLDDGDTWDPVALPAELTMVAAVAVDEKGNLWVGGREGVYYSTDYGGTWKTVPNLFVTQVDNIYADDAGHRVLVTAANSHFVFSAGLPNYHVTFWDTGWPMRFVRPVGDHLVGASLYDGVVVQPKMVESKFADPTPSGAVSH